MQPPRRQRAGVKSVIEATLARVLKPHPTPSPVTLNLRRIYLLPTRAGSVFALLLLLMLLGSINYGNSMGFVLSFLLASLAVVSSLHTWRELARLRVRARHASPVFAGQTARFELCLDNPVGYARHAVGVHTPHAPGRVVAIAAQGSSTVQIVLPAPERGWLRAPAFTVSTTFPLGLFRAWVPLDLAMRCLIYPRPSADRFPHPVGMDEHGEGHRPLKGGDDFEGLRVWRSGESPAQVAWKAVARGQGMLTKHFAGHGEQETWLDWGTLAGQDSETRLSRLTRGVLDAHDSGQRFGLRLPGHTIPPGTGEAHRRRCLEALALFTQ